MPAFVVTCDSPLPVDEAWTRVTNWPRHGDHVPLTTVVVTTPPPPGVGTVFLARTGLGPFAFDDPMEIVQWRPPHVNGTGHCRIEKRGRVMLGWAELTVAALGDGSRTTWREDAVPAHVPGFAAPLSAAAGRMLFGRAVRRLLA